MGLSRQIVSVGLSLTLPQLMLKAVDVLYYKVATPSTHQPDLETKYNTDNALYLDIHFRLS